MKILIVDDNEDSRMILKKTLESKGHTIEAAINGEEALDMAKIAPPDMIISDILMPVMDGFTLCRECKGDKRLKKIPFVFYTATYTDEKDEELALNMGAARFIRKPVEPHEFMEIIHSMIKDVSNGKTRSGKQAPAEEKDILKLYSKRLVKKLEEKMLGLEREIALRARTEEQLRQTRRDWENIFQAIGQPSLILDPEHNILAANRAVAKATAMSEEELIGRKCYEICHKAGSPPEDCPLNKLLLSGDVEATTMRVEALDGVFLASCTPVRDKAGRLVKVIHIATDITQRIRAEEELRKSDLRYRNVFENTGTATVILEEDATISMANAGFEKLSGYSKGELEGRKRWTEFVVEEDLERMKAYHIKRREEGKEAPTVYEFRFIDNQGDIKDIFLKIGMIPGTKESIASLIDITERKRSEETLKKSEERFSQVMETAQEWVWETNARGLYTYSSPVVEDILGYKPEEIVGKKHFYDLFHPDEREETKRLTFDMYSKKKRLYSFVNKNIDKKGNTVWLETRAVPVLNARGNLVGYRGVDTDITKRKLTEEALKESEERFRGLAESTPTAILLHQNNKWVYVNPAAEVLTGYTREKFLSMNFWDIVHPDFRQQVKGIGGTRENGLSALNRYECKIISKHGQEKWADVAGATTMLGGSPAGIITAIDITDWKHSETALMESEKKYRTLAETVTDIIFTLDMEGKFTYLNPEFEKITGYTVKDLTGRPFTEMLAPEYVESTVDRFRRGISGEEVPVYEIEFIHKDGLKTPVELKVTSLLDAGEKPAGRIGIARDITERKRLEAQLQQAQKMEAIGTLAGGIAHDFNNLLTAVQGNASLMLMRLDPGNDEYERLKNIEKCVQSGAALTKQLLGFARGGTYDVKPLDLGDLVRESAEMFGRTKKEIAIHEKYPGNLWTVEADSTQIEQVLLNLYVNAWQAMPAGGDLYLETENVDLDEDYVRVYEVGPGKYVKVSVTDTGVGMDEATRTRIFDPFFTTKEMGRGTGLGLASAYGIIRHHKGIINVYSEKGHGTTFSIYLPASSTAASDKGSQTGEDEVLPGEGTILLVDDENMIIDIATQMLQGLGYEVLSAQGGQEAVEVYKKNKDIIDLIILDMIMPGMGGGQTYDMLKDVNPDVSVILSSGYSINGQASAILERGCKGFIQKPFNMKGLSKKIREVLGE